MASIQDDRGYNQGFKETPALTIRTDRRSLRMIENMNLRPESRVLELGCGTGEMSDFLAKNTPAKVLGVDLCEAFIEEARAKYKRKNLEFEVLKIDPDNLQSKRLGTFDCIVGNGILHHLYYQLDQVLPDFRQKLKPGGKLLFWEPNLYNPYVFLIFRFHRFRKLAKLEPDEMAFTGGFIQKKLEAAGFQQIKVEYRDFLLPNTPTFLIKPVIVVGNLLERLVGIRLMSQSLFITAET